MGSIVAAENKPKNKCRKWRLFVSCGFDRHGKRIQRSRRISGTYSQAKSALLEFEEEVNGLGTEDALLCDYLDKWLKEREPNSAQTTKKKHRQTVRTLKHLFGPKVRLSDLTAKMVDEAMVDLLNGGGPSGRPTKPTYAGYVKKQLAAILRAARDDGYMVADIMAKTAKLPTRAPEKDNIPSAYEVRTLLEGLDPRDGHQMCVYLCATLGLRRSEALGLRWGNVDLEERQLGIVETLAPDGTYAPTKTPESRRLLPIPDHLAKAFRVRADTAKADLEIARRAGCENIPEWDELAVCCFPDGRPLTHSAASHWWDKHRSFYGISCGLHGLRHALLTRMAEQGVHPRIMASVAGHTNQTITLSIYAHSNMETKEAAFDAVSAAMAPK